MYELVTTYSEDEAMSMSTSETTARPLVLVVNGPNLNALGRRDPAQYGTMTLAGIEDRAREVAESNGWRAEFVQSNSEGELIDAIQSAFDRAEGIVINPGAFTHTSVAIRDALADTGLPVVEVHLSNVHARELFRHTSHVSGVALAVIAGAGWRGYGYAIDLLVRSREQAAG
jgi:3-dehydroquinate dehydratase II